MRYNELNETLKGRNAQSKKLANNTYLHRRGDNIALQYHSTDVATFTPKNDIILNSGGWHTSTTKERINMAIGNKLSQLNGVWYIGDVRFADGITIHANGKITGGTKDNPKQDKAIKAKVKKYAQLCAGAVPMSPPDSGDCWYCLMKTNDNKTLGDAIKDNEHIDSHIKESYIVPSLVLNALREAGNTDFILSLVFNNPNKNMLDVAKERVYKSVYRYILKRKGYAI
jgi:hypothetical protein